MFPSRRRRRRLDDSNSRRNQHAAEQRDTSPRQDVSPCESETAMPDLQSSDSVGAKLHSDFGSSASSGDCERREGFLADSCWFLERFPWDLRFLAGFRELPMECCRLWASSKSGIYGFLMIQPNGIRRISSGILLILREISAKHGDSLRDRKNTLWDLGSSYRSVGVSWLGLEES